MISITTPAPLWATGDPGRHDRQWKPKPGEFAMFARAIAARYAPARRPVRDPQRAEPARLAEAADRQARAVRAAPLPAARARRVPGDPGRRARATRSSSASWPRAAARTAVRAPRSGRSRSCARSAACRARSASCGAGAAVASRLPAPTRSATTPTSSSCTPRAGRATATTPRSVTGGRLLRFLDRLVARGRLVSARGGQLDVHYTEFGYQTDPPDPYAGIALQRQNRWLQEAGLRGVADAARAEPEPVPAHRRRRSCPAAVSAPTASSRAA